MCKKRSKEIFYLGKKDNKEDFSWGREVEEVNLLSVLKDIWREPR